MQPSITTSSPFVAATSAGCGRGPRTSAQSGVTKARQDAKARRAVAVEGHLALALRQQLVVEVERQVVQDGVVLGDAQVVRPAGAGQVDGHVVHQAVVLVHHAVVHVRRLLRVVEEHHVPGLVVHLSARPRHRHKRAQPGSAPRVSRVIGSRRQGSLPRDMPGQQLAGVDLTSVPRCHAPPSPSRRACSCESMPGHSSGRRPAGQKPVVSRSGCGRWPCRSRSAWRATCRRRRTVVHADGLVHLVVRVAHVDAVQVFRFANHLHVVGVGHTLPWRAGTGLSGRGWSLSGLMVDWKVRRIFACRPCGSMKRGDQFSHRA